jgi:DNA-binding transcriptional regulator YiaG
MRTMMNAQRKQFVALKKQVQNLEREMAALRKLPARNAPIPEEASDRSRFTAKGLKSLRGRLKLSAEDFGRLINVTAQTVYKWENGMASPRRKQVPLIAALRKTGKREVQRRLSELAAAS